MKRDKDAAELAWKMFEKTGNVSYYMLYKQLEGKDYVEELRKNAKLIRRWLRMTTEGEKTQRSKQRF